MARTQYTVTFPAARPGDEVTWPNTVAVYPDENTKVPLQSGQSLDESLAFSGWSDAASVVFTRPAGDNDTVTVTSGSPTGTGAAAPSAASSAVGSARFFYDQPPTVVANNLVFSQTDSDPDIGTGIGYDPATGLFAVAAGLVHVRVELSFAADTTGNGFATLRARNAGDTGSVAVGDAAQYQTPVGLPAGQILTLSDVLGVTAAGNVSVGWHQGTEAALDYCSVTVFTS